VGTPLTGFLSKPTDQLAVPGMLAGAEVTPEGDLYSGWAEYELRIGPRLRPWSQPTRTLPDPGLPLLSSAMRDGGVRYVQTLYAIAVGGRPVAYDTITAVNLTGTPRRARLAMALAYTRGRQIRGAHGILTGAYRYERPASGGREGSYQQPGRPFAAGLTYTVQGRDVLSSGLLLARAPAAPSRALGGGGGAAIGAAHAARLYTLELVPHGRAQLTWQIPLSPPAAGPSTDRALDAMPAARARSELVLAWRAQEAGMVRISVPEAKVTATFRAAISEILASRYHSGSGWVQGSNKLQYQAFWLRDAAIDTYALDLAGLHSAADRNLAFLAGYQQPDGLFISRPGQYDGIGQALWVLDRHARLAGGPSYAAAQLGRIGAAVAWLTSVTATDPLGLLPPSDPHDDELAYGHIAGDDIWAAAGIRSAIDAARLAGREDLARAWEAVDRRFESSLDRSIALAAARAGHIPPLLDSPAGWDWGNYYAAYPVQVLPAASPAVASTMSWARAHSAEGLATYAGGHSLHDYLGFSVFETELAAGDAAGAVAGLYCELAHTTATNAGWEWDIAPFGDRASPVNLAPHGTFAGDYVALLRNMLVADRSGGVVLLAGASPSWLGPGQQITLDGAPTEQGRVSFQERSGAHGETLRWTANLTPGTPLTWVLPSWARGARDASGRSVGLAIPLHGATGSLTVTFAGRRPRQSYGRAVAKLNAEYAARGRPAPIRPAQR
jgi:hypothetical protein